MADKTEIYKDKAGEFRWRTTAPNGDQTGKSSEGYKNKQDCIDNANRPKPHVPKDAPMKKN